MLQTLFVIPEKIGGVPLFGVGILLGVWAVAAIAILVWVVKKHGWGAEALSYAPLLATFAAVILLVPVFFEGGLPIRGYGVMLLLAGSSAVALAVLRARQVGVSTDLIVALAFWLFVVGIAGARLFFVIEYWEVFHRPTLWETLLAVVNVPEGGLVVYGSLIGAGIAFVAFVRKHKLPLLAMADLIAPSLVLGLALGRIGCLLNGCCFGGYCELPWAIAFPPESPPYEEQLARGGLYGMLIATEPEAPTEVALVAPGSVADQAGLKVGDQITRLNGVPVDRGRQAGDVFEKLLSDGPSLVVETADGRELAFAAPGRRAHSLPVHPTQIYSAINAALLCFFVWTFYPFRRHDGQVIALLLTIYPVTRFLLEIIRTDESSVFNTGLSISQNVSLLVLAGMVPLWWWVLRQPVVSLAAQATAPPPKAQSAKAPAPRAR
jgi:phosphatidylglycerol:prolipoprotein diacylglycerol transferase